MWRSWSNLAAFTAWHDEVRAALGIPYPNRNASTGLVDESAQWTTAYTEVTQVAADDWRAPVEDQVAESYPSGIGVICDPPPAPESDL